MFLLCDNFWQLKDCIESDVLQRSGKIEERLKKTLEKRLDKRGNTKVENLTKGTN